jgi:hypothetical protein
MKTTSKIIIALGILAVILAAGVYFLISNIDRIVSAGIEKYGSETTGTNVDVSSVQIKLKEGEGSIRNLSIGNPGGFTTPKAFSLENITVVVDTDSITGDPVIIDKVTISAPRITYEINKSGQSNIDVLKKNVESYLNQKTEPASKKAGTGDDAGKKMIIRSLVIEKGEVSIKVAALPGKPLSATLPRIALRNLGGKGGDSPGNIAAQILTPLVNQATRAASTAGIGQYLGKSAGEVTKALEEKAREKLGVLPGKDAAKDAGEAVKKLFGK